MGEISFDFGPGEGSALPSGSIHVQSVAGHRMPVLNVDEKLFYERLRDQYTQAYAFTNPSDVADLDSILGMELTVYRTNQQLGRGYDNSGLALSARESAALGRTLRDTIVTLAKAKDSLGLSKAARDAEGGEDDPATYLTALVERFKSFGLHRNRQVNVAIALIWEVCNVAGTWRRSNEMERNRTRFRAPEDVIDWIITEVQPKMEELDEHFRKNDQNVWIGKL